MPGARDDYLIRQIQQAAEAARRVRERLLGGATAPDVLPEIRAAERELLGAQGELLKRLDARSAGELLGDPQRLRAWAALLHAEAEAYGRDGRADLATRATQRAEGLEASAAAREGAAS